jgi:hypothetical protein
MNTEERLPAPNGVSPFERIRRTNAAGAEYWSSLDFTQITRVRGLPQPRTGDEEGEDCLFQPRPEERASRTHFEVGAKVRKAIQGLGGTMAENLPPAESTKRLGSRRRKQPEALEHPPSEIDATDTPQGEGGVRHG